MTGTGDEKTLWFTTLNLALTTDESLSVRISERKTTRSSIVLCEGLIRIDGPELSVSGLKTHSQ